MRRLALQGSVRRLLTRLHRWSGLTLLALLLVAGATGGVLTFRHEVERTLNPRLFVVAPAARRAALHDVIAGVETRFADARVSTVTLPSEAHGSLIVYLAARPGHRSQTLAASEAFVNPHTGEILGHRNRRQPMFSRENVVPTLIRLHYSLLLETPGVWLIGSAAAVWLLTSLVGLALAWPARWRHPGGWRPIVSVRAADGAYKFTYDLHRALGVGLLPIWLVLAFTSVYLNFPGLFRAATTLVASHATPPSRVVPPARRGITPVVTPDDAIARALRAVPGASAFGFTRDFVNGWYSVRLITADDVNPTGNSRAYIDFATGEVAALRLAAAASAGDRFLAWQFPLHSGEAFGLPGRLAIALAAIALVAMSATGLYIWWRGWTARRATAHRLKTAPDTAPPSARITFGKNR